MRNIYIVFLLLFVAGISQAQERDDTCDPIDTLIVNDTIGSITVIWTMNDTAIAYNYRYRVLGDTNWTTNATLDTFIVIDEDGECIDYEISISTVCAFDTSTFTLDTIRSFCPNATRPEILDPGLIDIYPTPFSSFLRVKLNDESIRIKRLIIRDLNGRNMSVIKDLTLPEINTTNWPMGVYLIEIETQHGIYVQKLLRL